MSVSDLTHWQNLSYLVLKISQGLFHVSCSASEELYKILGGSMARTSDWIGQRDIPHPRISCPVCKLGELPGRQMIAVQGQAGYRSAGGEQLWCCGGLTLAWHQVPTKSALLLPSAYGQGKHKRTSWVKDWKSSLTEYRYGQNTLNLDINWIYY